MQLAQMTQRVHEPRPALARRGRCRLHGRCHRRRGPTACALRARESRRGRRRLAWHCQMRRHLNACARRGRPKEGLRS